MTTDSMNLTTHPEKIIYLSVISSVAVRENGSTGRGARGNLQMIGPDLCFTLNYRQEIESLADMPRPGSTLYQQNYFKEHSHQVNKISMRSGPLIRPKPPSLAATSSNVLTESDSMSFPIMAKGTGSRTWVLRHMGVG